MITRITRQILSLTTKTKTTTQQLAGGGNSRHTRRLLSVVGAEEPHLPRRKTDNPSPCLSVSGGKFYGTIGSRPRPLSPYYSFLQQSGSIIIHRREFSTTNKNDNNTPPKKKSRRPDPFARRPTAKCDPYGQGGKPLPIWEANTLLATLDPQWKVVSNDDYSNEDGSKKQQQQQHQEEDNQNIFAKEADSVTQNNNNTPTQELIREFVHSDFISGSKFVSKIAAVAQLNMHFPTIQLQRRIIPNQKAWQVVTMIRCHTFVLGGLSTHDFHLAMLIDVEAARPEVQELIIQSADEEVQSSS